MILAKFLFLLFSLMGFIAQFVMGIWVLFALA